MIKWCTYDCMVSMYTEVYKDLYAAGLACKHEESVWKNADGKVVKSEEEAFGLKKQIQTGPPWYIEELMKRENYFKLFKKVQKSKGNSPNNWNSSDLVTMIQ